MAENHDEGPFKTVNQMGSALPGQNPGNFGQSELVFPKSLQFDWSNIIKIVKIKTTTEKVKFFFFALVVRPLPPPPSLSGWTLN